jgi:hypothetical protein
MLAAAATRLPIALSGNPTMWELFSRSAVVEATD